MPDDSVPPAAGQTPPCRPPTAAADGVIDLFGLLAYASLTAFFRLSDDAALAISLADKTALAEMAVAEFGHFQLLRAPDRGDVGRPVGSHAAVRPAVDAFHARTAPADWLEGLVKAYVGDGIAADFYRAVAQVLDPASRDLVLTVLADTGKTEFVLRGSGQATEARPAGRRPPGAVGQAAGGRGAGPGAAGRGRA